MAYGSRSYGGQRRASGAGAQGERWPSFNADPSAVHPFRKTSKDGREFDMMIVHLPDGTTVEGRDLTGFSISVFQGRYTREQLDQGRPVYVSFRPGRSVEAFKGRWGDPDYERINVDDPAELVAAVKQAQEAAGPAAAGQGGGAGFGQASGAGFGQSPSRPQRIGFIGKRDENGNLVPDQTKVDAMNARSSRGSYGRSGGGQGGSWPSFTVANAAVHPFTRTARNGNTYDMMVVNMPEGTTVDGHDLSGFSVSAFQNKRTKAQLSAGEDVTVSFRPGQPVDLFKGRRSDPDYQTFGVADPEILVKAVEAATATASAGASASQDDEADPWSQQAAASSPWGVQSAAQAQATGFGGEQEDDPWAAPASASAPASPESSPRQPQDASLSAWSDSYLSSPVTADDEASFDQDGYDDDYDDYDDGGADAF